MHSTRSTYRKLHVAAFVARVWCLVLFAGIFMLSLIAHAHCLPKHTVACWTLRSADTCPVRKAKALIVARTRRETINETEKRTSLDNEMLLEVLKGRAVPCHYDFEWNVALISRNNLMVWYKVVRPPRCQTKGLANGGAVW